MMHSPTSRERVGAVECREQRGQWEASNEMDSASTAAPGQGVTGDAASLAPLPAGSAYDGSGTQPLSARDAGVFGHSPTPMPATHSHA